MALKKPEDQSEERHQAPRLRQGVTVLSRLEFYSYGIGAVAWFEKELSRPVEESTAVVT